MARKAQTDAMTVTVKIVPRQNAPSKLGEAELHFSGGPLDGLLLAGFGIWQSENQPEPNVTLPSHRYIVQGEERQFWLLRSAIDGDYKATVAVRELILNAYAEAQR